MLHQDGRTDELHEMLCLCADRLVQHVSVLFADTFLASCKQPSDRSSLLMGTS